MFVSIPVNMDIGTEVQKKVKKSKKLNGYEIYHTDKDQQATDKVMWIN